jgi:hypothetical protein
MDGIAESLRARMEDAVPTVAEAIIGDQTFAHKPVTPDDEVRTFMNMTPQQRQQFFSQLDPDEYGKWTKSMMGKLTTRFGAAAQVLFPMLQGAPVEMLAQGMPLDQDGGSMGVSAAQMELTQLLGFDPLA